MTVLADRALAILLSDRRVRADYEAIETRVGHLTFHQSPAAAAVTFATSTNVSENVGALP